MNRTSPKVGGSHGPCHQMQGYVKDIFEEAICCCGPTSERLHRWHQETCCDVWGGNLRFSWKILLPFWWYKIYVVIEHQWFQIKMIDFGIEKCQRKYVAAAWCWTNRWRWAKWCKCVFSAKKLAVPGPHRFPIAWWMDFLIFYDFLVFLAWMNGWIHWTFTDLWRTSWLLQGLSVSFTNVAKMTRYDKILIVRAVSSKFQILQKTCLSFPAYLTMTHFASCLSTSLRIFTTCTFAIMDRQPETEVKFTMLPD